MTSLAARRTDPQLGLSPSAAIIGRSYSLSLPGVLYHLTTLFLAIGAINGQNNLLFWAFGLALGAILAGGVVSGAALMGVRAERIGIAPATAGELCTIRYAISSTARIFPAMALTVTEPAGKKSPRGVARRIPGEVSHVAPGGRTVTQAAIVPAHRGRLALDRFTVSSSFPFGTLGKLIRFSQPAAVLVRPQKLDLRAGLLDELLRASGQGDMSASGVGSGDEFFGVREYRAGDPLREIAWAPSARTDQLVVRQRSRERGRRVRVQLELAQGVDTAMAEHAIAVAGQIIRDAASRGLAVGLASDSAGISIAPSHASSTIERVLDALAAIELGLVVQPTQHEADRTDSVVWVAVGLDAPAGVAALTGDVLASAAGGATP